MSGQVNALAALLLVLTGQLAGWATQTTCMLCRREECLAAAGNWITQNNLNLQQQQHISSCTDSPTKTVHIGMAVFFPHGSCTSQTLWNLSTAQQCRQSFFFNQPENCKASRINCTEHNVSFFSANFVRNNFCFNKYSQSYTWDTHKNAYIHVKCPRLLSF